MRGKKTPLDQRANAVGIAVVAGGAEASRQTGIPEGTIYAWMARPEFKELRERNNEDLISEWRAGAQFAFRRAIELLSATEDPVKAATTGAIIFDKMQLASGGATSRTESRDLSGTFDDHELDLLRAAIDAQDAAFTADQSEAEHAVAEAGSPRTTPA